MFCVRYEVAGRKAVGMLQFPDSARGLSLVHLVSSTRVFWHVNHSLDPLADFSTLCVYILFYFPQSIGVLTPERKLDLKIAVSGKGSNPHLDMLTGMAATPLPAVFLSLSLSTAALPAATLGVSKCSFNLWPCLNGQVVSFGPSTDSSGSWIWNSKKKTTRNGL